MRRVTIFTIVFIVTACFMTTSCSKEQKVGKLEVAQVEYELKQDLEKVTISLDVVVEIKNIGTYDVKNVIVTGRCKSCTEVMNISNWFVTQQDKQPEQYGTINYIVAGGKEKVKFKGIAYFFKANPTETPESNPEGLEVYVESFETIQD